jgi:hypothetical protein
LTKATRQKDTAECTGIANRSYLIVKARHKSRPIKRRRRIDNRIVTEKRLPSRSSETSDAFIKYMEERGYKQEGLAVLIPTPTKNPIKKSSRFIKPCLI